MTDMLGSVNNVVAGLVAVTTGGVGGRMVRTLKLSEKGRPVPDAFKLIVPRIVTVAPKSPGTVNLMVRLIGLFGTLVKANSNGCDVEPSSTGSTGNVPS